MPHIHSSSIIHPSAELADDVIVGPFCHIGKGVHLGAGCELKSHVVLDGPSTFGERNIFYPFSIIGLQAQDLKYRREPTYLQVGSDNVFRENSNINRSTFAEGKTIIGSHNHFLVASHVGHDCIVGDHVIFSGYAVAAGHCHVGDYAIISGAAAVHQFVRIGAHSIIGGVARVVQDVPPYMISEGHPSKTRGINIVGLSRRGFEELDLRALKFAYKKLFLKSGVNQAEACQEVIGHAEYGQNPCVIHLIDFIKTTERGVS